MWSNSTKYFLRFGFIFMLMAENEKIDIKKQFGAYLKWQREEVLKETNLLVFSYNSKLDNSKLRKIERGEVDFRLETLIEIARTYKLAPKGILGFNLEIEE